MCENNCGRQATKAWQNFRAGRVIGRRPWKFLDQVVVIAMDLCRLVLAKYFAPTAFTLSQECLLRGDP